MKTNDIRSFLILYNKLYKKNSFTKRFWGMVVFSLIFLTLFNWFNSGRLKSLLNSRDEICGNVINRTYYLGFFEKTDEYRFIRSIKDRSIKLKESEQRIIDNSYFFEDFYIHYRDAQNQYLVYNDCPGYKYLEKLSTYRNIMSMLAPQMPLNNIRYGNNPILSENFIGIYYADPKLGALDSEIKKISGAPHYFEILEKDFIEIRNENIRFFNIGIKGVISSSIQNLIYLAQEADQASKNILFHYNKNYEQTFKIDSIVNIVPQMASSTVPMHELNVNIENDSIIFSGSYKRIRHLTGEEYSDFTREAIAFKKTLGVQTPVLYVFYLCSLFAKSDAMIFSDLITYNGQMHKDLMEFKDNHWYFDSQRLDNTSARIANLNSEWINFKRYNIFFDLLATISLVFSFMAMIRIYLMERLDNLMSNTANLKILFLLQYLPIFIILLLQFILQILILRDMLLPLSFYLVIKSVIAFILYLIVNSDVYTQIEYHSNG